MARGDLRQRVVLTLEDEATPKLEKAQGRFAKFGNFLKNSFVVTLGDVVRLFQGFAGAVGSFIQAAQDQEDAVNRLDAALRKTGSSAFSYSRALQAQAEALEEVTRFSDEAIISAQAFLAQLGVSPDQLELATEATTDLAAALGIDLQAAARLVGRTVGGFAGELGEVLPGLKEIGTEGLQAGEGIKFVAEQFAGTAQEDAKTFSGLIDQLGNAFSTLQQKVGEAITENEQIQTGLEELRTVITSPGFIEGVESIAAALVDAVIATFEFVRGANALVEPIRSLARAFDEWKRGLGGLADDLRDVVNLLGQILRFIPGFAQISSISDLIGGVERVREIGRNQPAAGTRPTTRSGGGSQE